MVQALDQAAGKRRTRYAVIDCDIHTAPRSEKTLGQYMPERWRKHHETFGSKLHAGSSYPKANMAAARTDSWPPNGGPPGSDLDFLREQLLDAWQIEYGIMTPLGYSGGQTNLEYGAAHATAINEWQKAEWMELEPRLRGSICVAYEDAALSVEEIQRQAGDRRFVQVLLSVRTSEPLGRRRYWPIYEAAMANDLPVAFHFGGSSGWPVTGAGFPSFYYEDHSGMTQSFEAQVISYIFEGVFDRFPALRIVLIEGGFAWLPPLTWRLDRAYARLKDEVPTLQRKPSEYIRDHFWVTTQPMEEPRDPEHFKRLVGDIGEDRLMFSTDYPHWDFDAPDKALPVRLPEEVERRIMGENARAFYRLG